MNIQTAATAFLLLIVNALVIGGQIPGGLNTTDNLRLGGNIYIAGTVFWPDGRPATARLSVRLLTPLSGEYSTSTDSSGQFVFAGLSEGRYRVIVDGDRTLETAMQDVEILADARRGPKPVFTVSIRMREKSSRMAPPGVVGVANESKEYKNAVRFYQKAIDLGKQSKNAEAIEQLKLAIDAAPDFFDAHNEMAVQYMRANDLAKADSALTEALRIRPNSPEALLNRSIILFRNGRFEDAEVRLRDLAAATDAKPFVYFYLGRTLTKLGKFDDAETQLNKAVKLGGSELREAHRMLAMLFIEKDDRPRAAAALEMYLSLFPEAPDAANLRQAISQLKSGLPK